jgi:type IV secretory pathway VirJ component
VNIKKILFTLLGLLLAAALVFGAHRSWPRWRDTDQFGRVRVLPAWISQRGFVYVLSGADGWSPADERTALYYAALGNYVTTIDTPRLLEHINQTAKGCVWMPGLFEDYSRIEQIAAGTSHFYEPTILGRGTGATLAYMAQIAAPPLAFGAAVVLDPEPQLALKVTPCEHPLQPQALGPYVPARVWLDASASEASKAFVAAVPGQASSVAPPGRSLRAVYTAALRDIRAEQQRGGVADLPLVEVPAPKPTQDAFAILYSGDGGWRDLDRSLADVLASKGMSVVGVDVLRYYWRRKAPDQAARDLARIIRHYEQRWGRRQVVLIGFSFGADVLPFLINRLPADVRADLRLTTLLSPERATAFEVQPSGWLGKQDDATNLIEPELQQLSTNRLQCVYGEDEAADSLCTTATAASHQIIKKAGGHHFDHNYGELADSIIAAAGAQ